AGGIAPEVDVALVEGAGVEGKQDRVAAAGADGLVERGELRPLNDVAHGAVAVGDVPVHEARAAFGQREEGGVAHIPAGEGFAQIRDFFHRGLVLASTGPSGKGIFWKQSAAL